VVKVDRVGARIFAIGGNVGSTVSLKVLAGVHDDRVGLRPVNRLFAHLKLRADPIEAEAFDNTPTIKALSERLQGLCPKCARGKLTPAHSNSLQPK
jgi:hypothetical protein